MIQHIVNLKLSRKQPQGGAKVHAEEQTGCLVHRSQKLAVAKGEQTKNACFSLKSFVSQDTIPIVSRMGGNICIIDNWLR